MWCKQYLLRWLLLLWRIVNMRRLLLRWWLLLLLMQWLLLLWRIVNMRLLLQRWWLLLRWRIRKRILWMWLDVNHLMTPIVVSMAEHFRCLDLEHNAHNGEVLVVVVTICTQPTLKKIISLEQNLNECRVLITGERERVNLSSWVDVCKVSKLT